MKRKILVTLLAAEACLLVLLIGFGAGLHFGLLPDGEVSETATEPVETTAPAEVPVPETTAVPETEAPETEAPTTEPQEIVYNLTFAGDCTLGTMYDFYDAGSCFPAVVGEDYAYPLANVQEWFADDDFSLVNLEGPLTSDGEPADKDYVFRGDPKLVGVLTEGSVEAVNIANNHTRDFGDAGYESTKKVLDDAGIFYGEDGESILVDTERGLKVGVFFTAFSVDTDYLAQSIQSLRDQGAEIVIASFHWGIEGEYRHSYDQESLAHAAIDAGADIVFGHHPHVLQEIEEYNGGIIYYSLANFVFGGNGNPRDYDTAVISQQVIRDVDGTVRLGEYTAVPCSISSVDSPNNYQPTPAPEGSERYQRVMDKLSGNFSVSDGE